MKLGIWLGVEIQRRSYWQDHLQSVSVSSYVSWEELEGIYHG